MADETKHIFEQALRLNSRERVVLAAQLLESLDAVHDEGVEAAWSAEIERRMADLDSGSVQGIPWSDVKAQLPAK